MRNLSKLSLAENFLVYGNLLGAISMALISIGAILRKSEILPDTPIFSASGNEGVAPLKDVNRNTNHSHDYWGNQK